MFHVVVVLFFQPCSGSINMYPNSCFSNHVVVLSTCIQKCCFSNRSSRHGAARLVRCINEGFKRVTGSWVICHTCWPCPDVYAPAGRVQTFATPVGRVQTFAIPAGRVPTFATPAGRIPTFATHAGRVYA